MLPEEVIWAWYATIPNGAPWDSLSEVDKNLIVVYDVELQVSNGGFHQLFLHCGHEWERIIAALAAVGCNRIAVLIKQAMAVLPEGVFVADHARRYEHMWKIGKAAEAELNRLTEEYYELCPGEPYVKMQEYLDRGRGLTSHRDRRGGDRWGLLFRSSSRDSRTATTP
jgi:hypothetical protein